MKKGKEEPNLSEECCKMSPMTIQDLQKINVMSNIRRIAQKAIKEKGLTEQQVRKSLGIKRYEK